MPPLERSVPPLELTLSSSVLVERAMPPTDARIAVLPNLGPNPERNPAELAYALPSLLQEKRMLIKVQMPKCSVTCKNGKLSSTEIRCFGRNGTKSFSYDQSFNEASTS